MAAAGTSDAPRFQSTLPAREATIHCQKRPKRRWISIHASREGSDISGSSHYLFSFLFQSTLPAREATAENSINSLQILCEAGNFANWKAATSEQNALKQAKESQFQGANLTGKSCALPFRDMASVHPFFGLLQSGHLGFRDFSFPVDHRKPQAGDGGFIHGNHRIFARIIRLNNAQRTMYLGRGILAARAVMLPPNELD